MTETIVMPKTKKEIEQYFAKNKWNKPSAAMIKLLQESKCRCESCGNNLERMYDEPFVADKEVLCENCYTEQNYDTCPICEDYYPKSKGPKDTFLVIAKEYEDEVGVKAGFYGVKKYPVYRAAVAFGFESLYEENIELLRECDINGMLSKIYGSHCEKVDAQFCCPECKDKYCGIKPVDRYVRKAENSRVNKIIKAGQ